MSNLKNGAEVCKIALVYSGNCVELERMMLKNASNLTTGGVLTPENEQMQPRQRGLRCPNLTQLDVTTYSVTSDAHRFRVLNLQRNGEEVQTVEFGSVHRNSNLEKC